MSAENMLRFPEVFPGMEQLPAFAVYLMGCRSFEQFCCTVRALQTPEEFCPFCEAELTRRKREPMQITKRWRLYDNEFPHRNTAKMLLIMPKLHVVHPNQMEGQDWYEVGILLKKCMETYGLLAGGLLLRFGDPHLHAGTIEHLYFNIIKPVCGKEYRPPLAKNIAEHEQDYKRMCGLRSALVGKGGLSWLFSDLGIKETQPKMV